MDDPTYEEALEALGRTFRVPVLLPEGSYDVSESIIRFLDKPEATYPGQIRIGWYGGWSVEIHVMIFNDRLVLAEPGQYGSQWYSWCFDKGGAAHLAALIWNPETEGEPSGYKKAAAQAFGRPRESGERAYWWHPPMV